MHARKAVKQLWDLSKAPGDLLTLTQAYVLLDALSKLNQDVEKPNRLNGTARDKIREARSWFEILCGVGEDGDWPEDQIRTAIYHTLGTLEDQIDRHNEGPTSRFVAWPAN